MGKLFSAIFGGAPKAKAPEPVKTKESVKGAEEDKGATKRRRANLFETEGGVAGQELSPEQVQKRPTLFGN